MKKILLLLSIILLSCSKEENNSESNNYSIIGTWHPKTAHKEDDDCSLHSRYVFNTNNTYTVVDYYTYNECTSDTYTGTWSIENNQLTLYDGEDYNTLNFEFISENEINITNDISHGLSSQKDQIIIKN